MWTLEEALVLCRTLQPSVTKFGYHLCLGGGVLNIGRSDKDLDLYLLPLAGEERAWENLCDYLGVVLGESESLRKAEYADAEAPGVYNHMLKFDYGTKRVDLFIMGSANGSDT